MIQYILQAYKHINVLGKCIFFSGFQELYSYICLECYNLSKIENELIILKYKIFYIFYVVKYVYP